LSDRLFFAGGGAEPGIVSDAHFDQARRPFGVDVMHCGWAAGRYGNVVPRASDGVWLDADTIGDAIEVNVGAQ